MIAILIGFVIYSICNSCGSIILVSVTKIARISVVV